VSALSDPADKLIDAQADGAFGGKPINRRAGYSTDIEFGGRTYTKLEWIRRAALKDATLASGEGRMLVEHYEQQLAAVALRYPNELAVLRELEVAAMEWLDVYQNGRMGSLQEVAANRELQHACHVCINAPLGRRPVPPGEMRP
jgi:hypothetical protein